jgi:multiple sugar transport system substrate-binding protein
MPARLTRAGVVLATVALIATACTGSAASQSPSSIGAAPSIVPSLVPSKGSATVPPGGPVQIRWYCCLGGGEAPEQKAVEDKVVADFNASHPNIHVTFEVVTYDQANGQLTTEIQSGNPPDIVGPVGIGGANAFHGKWLDLAPYIAKTSYDLSGFPANVVDIYKLQEGQVGIPFAIYPSALFYKKDLFEEAGLNEPPHKYGDKYQMPDGSMVDWSYDTARQVAKLLTVDKNQYDLSGFPESVVDIYKLDEGQVGIPFAIYPSALFYRKGAFEEAGLKEPHHKYGEKYTMADGSQVDWTYDVARELGKKLTVDKAGKDATQAGFDPKRIAQWGFELQRDDLRGTGAYFGAGSLSSGEDGKTVQIPADWIAGWKYFYQSIWTDHIAMTGPQFESKDLNPEDYPFFTGNVAMSENFLWSTYGLSDVDDWDLAAIPAHHGVQTSVLNADTFRILKSTKHPDEAFEFLTYLLGEASGELMTAYGGFPARTADQAAGIKALQDQFKHPVDWQVAVDGAQHPDNPNFESWMPDYNESLGEVGSGGTFLTRWSTMPNLNMDTEVEALKAKLEAIWNK